MEKKDQRSIDGLIEKAFNVFTHPSFYKLMVVSTNNTTERYRCSTPLLLLSEVK